MPFFGAMKMKKRLALCLAGVLVWPAWAANPQPPKTVPIKQGMAYAKARKLILKAGWEPIHAVNGEACGYGEKICKKFPEIESCLADGYCKMFFKNEWDMMLVLITLGDMDAKGENAQIESWSLKK